MKPEKQSSNIHIKADVSNNSLSEQQRLDEFEPLKDCRDCTDEETLKMFDDVREDIRGFFKSKEGCERIKILNPSYFNELCEFLFDGNNKKFTFFYEEALFFPPNAVDSLILRMVFKDNFLKENGLFKKALKGEKQRLKNIKSYQTAA